jgi:hypothetical protein
MGRIAPLLLITHPATDAAMIMDGAILEELEHGGNTPSNLATQELETRLISSPKP